LSLTTNFRLDEFRCRHCGDVNAAIAHILTHLLALRARL
jgi:transposase